MPDESERKIERDTGEQQIRHREAEQREPYLSAGKIRRDSLRRLLQADDDPGLASRLGDVPAAGIHDIDERQQPGNQAQEPGEAQGIALPREEERQKSEADHGTADADHEAEAPEESRDIRPVVARPVLLLRRGLQVIDAAHRACRLVVEHEGEERGHLELRTVLVRLLVNVRDDGEGRGIRCKADDVVVTSGSQQSLDVLARALINPGDTVVVERPTYLAALQVFGLAQAHFESGAIKALGDNQFEVSGKLTIKGKTIDVVVPSTFKEEAGKGIFAGSFTIRRGDFAIGEGSWSTFDIVANDIQVKFTITANPQ